MSIESKSGWIKRIENPPPPPRRLQEALRLELPAGAALEIREMTEAYRYVMFSLPSFRFLDNVPLDSCPELVVPWLCDILRQVLPKLENILARETADNLGVPLIVAAETAGEIG